MPTFKSFADFAAALDKLTADLTGPERKRITREMAGSGQKLAESAASSDLGGDPKFSGWKPPLETQIRSARNFNTLLTPTRHSAGPWTVAERGRNTNASSGFLGPGVDSVTGLTARTKKGNIRVVRARAARRWNGRTAGKNTASDAVRAMEAKLPDIAEKGVAAAIERRFD